MTAIAIQKLTKRYGRSVGVEDLDLTVARGCIYGFLGPNGSGKTTTIRVLLGLLKPTTGDARIFDRDCWSASHVIKADVGYMPGDVRLYPWLCCRNALSLFSAVRRLKLIAYGMELAEAFGLDLDVCVRDMSRGMRQKLGLILALAHRPKLLVLDEPTASLDPLMQETLYNRLREFASEGSAVFFSSHTLSEVDQLCDRVAILRRGRLVEESSLHDLRKRARRIVKIRWSDANDAKQPDIPGFLEMLEQGDGRWTAALTSPVPELLRWASNQRIEDLSISEPDLGRVFQTYYE